MKSLYPFFKVFPLFSRHKLGTQAHLDLHHKIIQEHWDHAYRQDDALCIPLGNAVLLLDDALWHHCLGLWQIGSQIDPFGCDRRWIS